ncbi:hypothetical protein [Salinicoccus sp. CNSTN-B1]
MYKDRIFELSFIVVCKGIQDILEQHAKASSIFLNGYMDYPLLSYRKNGFPSISRSTFGPKEPINYGYYLMENRSFDKDKIDVTKYKEYKELESLLLKCDKFLKVYRPPNQDSLGVLNLSVLFKIHDLINKNILEYGEGNNLTETQFLKYYKPLENRIFLEELDVVIYIPILFTKFDIDDYILNDQMSITRMSDVFQKSRANITSYSESVPDSVLMSATHALKIEGFSVPNYNYWLENPLRIIENYPLDLINSFFDILRVNDIFTGYAQVISKPIEWAEKYEADFLDLKGGVKRVYPVQFNDYYWNKESYPAVNESQLNKFKRELNQIIDNPNKKIQLAFSRLENSLYRHNEGDRIIDIAIGLESLLSDDEKSELTHKLALRCAFLLQKSPLEESKLDIFKNMKAIYAYRSAVVHGSNQKKLDKKKHIQDSKGEKWLVIDLAEKYLKECIKVLLKQPEFLEAKNIDEKLILT